jgi:hypothetical protein
MNAQGLLLIALNRVVLAIRYLVQLIFFFKAEQYRIGLTRWLTNVSRCVVTYCGMELRFK